MSSFLDASNRSTTFKFLASIWFMYCGQSCVIPHLTRFYDIDLHLKDWQIGTLMALPSLGALMTQPLWGVLADRYLGRTQTYRLVLIVLSLLLIFYSTAYRMGGYGLLLFAAFLMMTCYGATSPLSSSLILTFLGTSRRHLFGRVRSVGSLSYMLTVFLVCPVLVEWGDGMGYTGRLLVFHAATVFYLMAVACTGWDEKKFQHHKRPDLSSFAPLLYNPRLLVLYISIFLAVMGSSAGIQYLGPYVSHRGFSELYYSSLWLIGVGVEVILTFFLHQLMRILSLKQIITLSFVAEGIRWLGMNVVVQSEWIQMFFALHGLAVIGIFFASAMFLDSECEESIRSTAQSLLYFSVVIGQVSGYIGGSWIVSSYSELPRDEAIRSSFFWFGLTGFAAAGLFSCFVDAGRPIRKIQEKP